MNLIAELDQHQLGWFSEADQGIKFHRRAARAVLRDNDGRIAVMYLSTTGSSKLPGGGIDEAESVESALRREIPEETGCNIKNIVELGVVEERRYIPGMKQTSYCFKADVAEYLSASLTPDEAAQGMELRWHESFEAAIAAIQSSHVVEEGREEIELEMMKLREVAILRAAMTLV